MKDQVDQLSNQLGIHEDTNAIRALHQTYESYLDRGMYEEVVNLFADDGEVFYNGGFFAGKERGVRRLYCDHFRAGFTGKKIEPAPGFELDPDTTAGNRRSGAGPQVGPGSIRLFHAGGGSNNLGFAVGENGAPARAGDHEMVGRRNP